MNAPLNRLTACSTFLPYIYKSLENGRSPSPFDPMERQSLSIHQATEPQIQKARGFTLLRSTSGLMLTPALRITIQQRNFQKKNNFRRQARRLPYLTSQPGIFPNLS